MKGIIGNIRGQKVGGKLTINVKRSGLESAAMQTRLLREFPDYDPKVFGFIQNTLIKEGSLTLPREEFVERVRLKLLGVAILMFPESDFPDDISLSDLYLKFKSQLNK